MLVCDWFKRMAHGMFDITLGLGTGWQMVLPSMHLVDAVPIIT